MLSAGPLPVQAVEPAVYVCFLTAVVEVVAVVAYPLWVSPDAPAKVIVPVSWQLIVGPAAPAGDAVPTRVTAPALAGIAIAAATNSSLRIIELRSFVPPALPRALHRAAIPPDICCPPRGVTAPDTDPTPPLQFGT